MENKIDNIVNEINRIKKYLGLIPRDKTEYEKEIEQYKEQLKNKNDDKKN